MNQGISVVCAVTSGLFASEYVVKIANKDTVLWEGAVDREFVTHINHDDVQKERYIEGRLLADLVEKYQDGTVLVELPSEGWSRGRRIQVPLAFIKPERLPA